MTINMKNMEIRVNRFKIENFKNDIVVPGIKIVKENNMEKS